MQTILNGRSIEEVKKMKEDLEQELYIKIKSFEIETGLKVEDIVKRTTAGGYLDPWCSMTIRLKPIL